MTKNGVKQILQIGDPLLSKVSHEVNFPLGTDLEKVINYLFATLKSVGDLGVGLSAVQIGYLHRICIVKRLDWEEQIETLLHGNTKGDTMSVLDLDNGDFVQKLQGSMKNVDFEDLMSLLSSERLHTKQIEFIKDLLAPYLFEVLINPIVLASSEEESIVWEGCLSVGVGDSALYAPVSRANEITVEYQNILGQEKTFTVENWMSHLILHEIDHMNGLLFLSKVENIEDIHKSKELDDFFYTHKRYPRVDESF